MDDERGYRRPFSAGPRRHSHPPMRDVVRQKRWASRLRAVLSFGPALLLAFLLTPEMAAAWGPATHIALGEAVLGALHLLPPAVRATLHRYPLQFLYGSVAADISFAKKYAPVGRHCHDWRVGREILEEADTQPLRAVAYGYLAHLAADTVAHNIYVPRRLLLTSSSQAVGHTYWEYRMDVGVGEPYLGKAREVVTGYDHSEADEHFDRVLSRTLFSFRTNRRIFRGWIRVQDHESWKRTFDAILRRSRFDLPADLRTRYMNQSLEYVMDYLAREEESHPWSMDPIGEMNLRLAKKLRRRGLADGGLDDPGVLEKMADDFFPFPDEADRWLPRLKERPGGGIILPGRIQAADHPKV